MEWKLVISLSVLALCSTFVYGNDEAQLKLDLMKEYKAENPPIEKGNGSVVTVKFGLQLNQITNVDEPSNAISIVAWMKMEFLDNRLQWQPDVYNDITKMRIAFSKIWLPDIMLFNRISGTQFSSQEINALVYNTGVVKAVAPMQLTATCEMDLTYFPYDKQSCSLKFGSWSSDKSVIELALLFDEIDLNTYQKNPDWELTNTTFKLKDNVYPCCPTEVYQDATAMLEIKRRSAPYAVKLVIPSVLTAFLILFTFILPSSSGEKIVFCLILLLSLILLSVYLQVSVPSNTESVLGEFLTFALFLDFFATIIAVICYNVADALLMRDKLGGPESEKHWASRKRKLKALRIAEYVFFLVFLLIFIIGTAVILCRRG